MLLLLLLGTSVLLTLSSGSEMVANTSIHHHPTKRFIPFIYPHNSIIQFALGMALPAEVSGRNVATNSGIMININLPTNLSELRPPVGSLQRSLQHQALLRQIGEAIQISDNNREACIRRSICWLDKNYQYQGTLFLDIFKAFLDSFMHEEIEEYKMNTSSTLQAENLCLDSRQKCDSVYIRYIEEIFQWL